MTPDHQKIIDTQQKLIDAAESDQKTNQMSKVSDVTLLWMYRMRDAAKSAIVEVEGDVTVNVQTNAPESTSVDVG